MNSKTNGFHSQTLSDVCADIYSIGSYLRKNRDSGTLDALYDKMITLFNSMEGKARDLKIASGDIEDAKYALAAFIDEAVEWESRLEQHFFRSNIAGEEFFDKLEQIRENRTRTEVLEVYYFCLILGFEGRYVRSPARLREIIADLQQLLNITGPEKLSPKGARQQETIKRRRSGIPAWVPWILIAIGVVSVGVTVIFMRSWISNWAVDVINRIKSISL
jgi:type VI secretion system protein ImpK